jgi:hypothetical protein
MTIGQVVDFVAVFEADESNTVKARGTVADIRNGRVWVFVLGCRWPFEIKIGDKRRRGFYPLTARGAEK